MDISVSQLNNRLALQLPAELPLGLVFVAGELRRVSYDLEGDGRVSWATFDLEQEGYSLRCRLSFREGEEVNLDDGVQVRLGGHLTFDAQRAQYFLLARDVELLGEIGSVTEESSLDLHEAIQDEAALLAALASIKRRSEVAQQASELPIWVQKLAPEEVHVALPPDGVDIQESRRERKNPQLNDEVVAYLSSVMDSEDEVELTPELLAELLPVVDPPENDDPLNSEAGTTAVAEDDAMMSELQEWSDSLAGVGEEAETALQPYDPVMGEEQAAKPNPNLTNSPNDKPKVRTTDLAVLLLLVLLIVIAFGLIYAIYNAAF